MLIDSNFIGIHGYLAPVNNTLPGYKPNEHGKRNLFRTCFLRIAHLNERTTSAIHQAICRENLNMLFTNWGLSLHRHWSMRSYIWNNCLAYRQTVLSATWASVCKDTWYARYDILNTMSIAIIPRPTEGTLGYQHLPQPQILYQMWKDQRNRCFHTERNTENLFQGGLMDSLT